MAHFDPLGDSANIGVWKLRSAPASESIDDSSVEQNGLIVTTIINGRNTWAVTRSRVIKITGPNATWISQLGVQADVITAYYASRNWNFNLPDLGATGGQQWRCVADNIVPMQDGSDMVMDEQTWQWYGDWQNLNSAFDLPSVPDLG